MSASKDINNDYGGLTTENPLTAKTEKLNESTYLLNSANPVKVDCASKSDRLLMANEDPAKTNENLVKLNKELVAVSAELERLSEQVKHQNMRHREFIRITSNEVRASTQSILGHVELLISESQSNSENVEPITRSAIRFQQIISDVMESSKTDNNM